MVTEITDRRATQAISRLRERGPRPARLVVGHLQRVVLKGANIFGVRTLSELDAWVLRRMKIADQVSR